MAEGTMLQVAVPEPGKYRVILDSDDKAFDGEGRVGHDTDHFSSPESGSVNLSSLHTPILAEIIMAYKHCANIHRCLPLFSLAAFWIGCLTQPLCLPA